MSIPDEPGNPVEDLLSSPEVTRAVETEEFKRFLDHMPFAIAVSKGTNGQERIVYGNARFQQLLGEVGAAFRGQDWSVLDPFTHEDDDQLRLGRAVCEGTDFLGTFGLARSEGQTILIEAYASLIENDEVGENYRITAFVTVTGRARSQREEFQRQLRDKDLLLREVQHRVKNNLQLIVALIRLEARNARDGAKTVDVERLAGRIEAVPFYTRRWRVPGRARRSTSANTSDKSPPPPWAAIPSKASAWNCRRIAAPFRST